jgi:hypothetical protein
MTNRPDPLPDGLYFSLDKDRYHADTALGSGDIRALMVHPAVYWWQSYMNPMHQPSRTKWLDWGSAFHVLICEGEAAFVTRYYRGLVKESFPDLLVTQDDLREWLAKRGKAVSGSKAEQIKRVLGTDPDAPVWETLLEKHNILANGRHILPAEDFDSVMLSSKMITKNPECAKAFLNGYPEVSVFWTDRYGVRLKCRIDYLRFRAVVDLKSFRNRQQMRILRAMFNAIGSYRLDIQAAHYLTGRAMIPEFIRAGKVFGENQPSGAWLDRLRDVQEPSRFVWIFYQAEGAPISRRIEYEPAALYHESALSDIGFALESYRHFREVFGEDIWVDVSEKHVMNTEDLPAYMGVG